MCLIKKETKLQMMYDCQQIFIKMALQYLVPRNMENISFLAVKLFEISYKIKEGYSTPLLD